MPHNQTGRRRPPPPKQPFHQIMDRAMQESGLPDSTKDQLRLFAKLLEKYLGQAGHASYNGFPAPHAETHQPSASDPFLHADEHLPSGGDPITTEAPSGKQFDVPPEVGEAEALARADHVHNKPFPTQVHSSVDQDSLKDDILWLAGRNPWIRVLASQSFK